MKPHVICHMMRSVDGRIITEHWKDLVDTNIFETIHNTFESEAWMCGRVTMERDFAADASLPLDAPDSLVLREDFVANATAESYAIAIDKDGKLRWDNDNVDGDHIIEVLTESVPDVFLNYLRQQGISYIFAGEHTIDFKLALDKIGSLFPIKTLMLEGGGHLNGSMLDAGLIDELSLLCLPIADGTADTATVFEKKQDAATAPRKLKLLEVRQLDDDIIWSRYKVLNA